MKLKTTFENTDSTYEIGYVNLIVGRQRRTRLHKLTYKQQLKRG